MAERESGLREDTTEWLLERSNPTVRYLTLRHLLKRGAGDSEVEQARKDIMRIGPVPKILAKQALEGHWGKPEDFYVRSKYKGTVWNFIFLAELYADPEDERIKRACEFILKWSQDRYSGGFSYSGTSQKGGQRSGVICCLTGNMAFSLLRLGYARNPRVIKALDWITTYQRYEIVSEAPRVWPYVSDHCWRDHTCRSGAVKSLKALAEVPEEERSKEIKAKIEEGAEYLLAQQIFKKPPRLKAVARKEWFNLGFPLMWNTDLLEILGILTRLGYRDKRMNEAVEAVISKRGENGRWRQGNRFEGRFAVPVERNGAESKWVTLNALRMLDALQR
ncbi:MAG: hypothetical protein LUO85_00725 [Methanomassiliicoccales archaeon]|nr:hypothetical protein [Methanomassiliicoccales archaeon]